MTAPTPATPKAADPTRVVTPVAICSYPHLFEPWTGVDGSQEATYRVVLVFPAGTDLTELKRAVLAAARKKFKNADDLIRSGALRMPFRTDEKPGYPPGSVFITANAKAARGPAPGVVSRYADPVTKKPRKVTKDEQVPGNPNEVYAGCLIRAAVNAYGYDRQGNKGVSFGLNGVQKVDEGKRLDNRVAAEDTFEADLSEAPASIDDLASTSGQSLDDLM